MKTEHGEKPKPPEMPTKEKVVSQQPEQLEDMGVQRDSTLGQYEAAIDDYNRAIRLKPDNAGAYMNRGTVKSELGQYEAAIDDYNQAIRIKPDFVKAYMNRGVAKKKIGVIEEAKADFQIALELAESTGYEILKSDIKQQLQELNSLE